MEASSCLITPPSKTCLDPLPSLKSRVLISDITKKRHSRVASKFPAVICCSGLRGEGDLHVNSDWRTFRARLVAGERLPPRLTTEDSLMATSLPLPPLGDKWAHPLHAQEKGCLLLATPKLDGVHIFERAIILLLDASPTRLSGVILNRPSLMSITSTSAAAFSGCPLFFGGPIKEEGLFLLRAKSGTGVFEEVMDGLYYGTRESVGCAAEMVRRGAVEVEELLFFDGCCGWEKQQLEEEVTAGYWSVVACSRQVVAAVAVGAGTQGGGGGVWEEVVGLAGERRIW